jgi:hypothetical protein
MSLKNKTFKVGDMIYHMKHEMYGIVKKDVSNLYAEVYTVEFTSQYGYKSMHDCCEGLMVKSNNKKEENMNVKKI